MSRPRLRFRERLALTVVGRLWPLGQECLVEGLMARADRAPKEGEVVIESERHERMVSALRAEHRRTFPHAMRDRMTVAEMLDDLRVAPLLDEAGAP